VSKSSVEAFNLNADEGGSPMKEVLIFAMKRSERVLVDDWLLL
jgi:hypothetical protein